MRELLFGSLLCLFSFGGYAQGSIRVDTPEAVQRMLDHYVATNKGRTQVDGWRIQLIATPDRRKMENALARFRGLYPGIRADWVHAKPYYKVRVGAYATKLDAMRTLDAIRRDYPEAYPTRATLRPQELVN